MSKNNSGSYRSRKKRIPDSGDHHRRPSKNKNYPQQFFGYANKTNANAKPYYLDEEGLVCLVSNITELNKESVEKQTGSSFKINDWFLSTGSHENSSVHGPFSNPAEAIDLGKKLVHAETFRTQPKFNSQEAN